MATCWCRGPKPSSSWTSPCSGSFRRWSTWERAPAPSPSPSRSTVRGRASSPPTRARRRSRWRAATPPATGSRSTFHGRWLEPLAGERVDLILANPPYVTQGDPHLRDLRFEPLIALVSGTDGLDAIREIVREAPRHLRPGGWLLMEHGMGQDTAVRALFSAAGLEEVDSCPDLARIPRVAGGKVK